MKAFSCGAIALGLLAACGAQKETSSELTAEKFGINVLGIEMGSCTQDELTRFIAGENVPPISGKLPREQQIELRQKFSRVIHFPAPRAQEALQSKSGDELNQILSAIFPRDYAREKVAEAFVASVEDNQFTLLEFVSRYPVEKLRVNGLVFLSRKGDLEQALIRLEDDFNRLSR